MLAVIIPTLNAADHLAPLLDQLTGHVDRLVVADGGSTDQTLELAVRAGAVIATGGSGRGQQMRRGADWAGDADWYLFIHADCILPENWLDVVETHILREPERAGFFRFRPHDNGVQGQILSFFVGLRHIWPFIPYGDQGLLISRKHYDRIGGYPNQALFEDVEIIEKIKAEKGSPPLRMLPASLTTDISKHLAEGVMKRGRRNFKLLMAYRRGVPVEELIRRYQAKP